MARFPWGIAGWVLAGSALVLSAALAAPAAATYQLVDVYDASNFFASFDFFTDRDPTHGFVQYIGQTAATARGLAAARPRGAVYLGVDAVNTTTTGRASVRLTSKKAYTRGLFLADIEHMPAGAGPGGYGAAFNAAGGGVYALEWTDRAIRVWFFSRGSEKANELSSYDSSFSSSSSSSSSSSAVASSEPGDAVPNANNTHTANTTTTTTTMTSHSPSCNNNNNNSNNNKLSRRSASAQPAAPDPSSFGRPVAAFLAGRPAPWPTTSGSTASSSTQPFAGTGRAPCGPRRTGARACGRRAAGRAASTSARPPRRLPRRTG
ncbi:hypothetical protein VTJ83DRAFT_2144 [Remersonia thermophila]|uniref:Dirigent protein n=1 Tax=Remersonia thermophila TaxID=72144 RepID=A0ABR4DHW3_9PEZI